jgi:hypothetical protein
MDADPYHWISDPYTDTAPDSTFYFRHFQDANKKVEVLLPIFIKIFLLHECIFTPVFKVKKSQNCRIDDGRIRICTNYYRSGTLFHILLCGSGITVAAY